MIIAVLLICKLHVYKLAMHVWYYVTNMIIIIYVNSVTKVDHTMYNYGLLAFNNQCMELEMQTNAILFIDKLLILIIWAKELKALFETIYICMLHQLHNLDSF